MKIVVKAKTGSKEEKVVEPQAKLLSDDEEEVYTVWVKERPVEGRANDAIVRALSEHFGVPRASVRLIRGATSRVKLFEIKGC